LGVGRLGVGVWRVVVACAGVWVAGWGVGAGWGVRGVWGLVGRVVGRVKCESVVVRSGPWGGLVVRFVRTFVWIGTLRVPISYDVEGFLVKISASDVADFDSWDSGLLGVEEFSLSDLAHDVAYGRSYWEEAGEGVRRGRERGVDYAAASDVVSGVGGGLFSVLGWGSPGQLKAGLAGAIGLFGLKGLKASDRSRELWAASTLANDVQKARRSAGFQGLRGLDEDVLADGANQIVTRLGYEAPPGVIPGGGIGSDDIWEAPNFVGAGMRGGRWQQPATGSWSSNPTAELLPTEYVARFAEFDRGASPLGTDVDAMARDLFVNGFNDPLILEVDSAGRALLTEGNHRIAAAQRAGISAVPVRVVTSSRGALGERGAAVSALSDFGQGKLLKPSEAIDFGSAAVADAAAGRIRMFHGVSPIYHGSNAASLDDVLKSVMKDGLVPDPNRVTAGPYVWASPSPRVAGSFAIGDEGEPGIRVIAEFVTDPKRVQSRNGYPSLSNVPKDDIAAIHLTDKAGDVTLTYRANWGLGSVLDDIGVSRSFSGGFTWNPRTGSFDFASGYGTGISPLHTLKIPVNKFHARNVLEYLTHRGDAGKSVARVLAEDPDTMIGGWVHKGDVYLDISKIFAKQDEAEKVARQFGEIAIWDFAKSDEIIMQNAQKAPLMWRAQYAGGARAADDLRNLPFYFGGEEVAGGVLSPEMATVAFEKMSTGQKEWFARELLKQKPVIKFTAEDFKNKSTRDWLRGERQRLLGLSDANKARLGAKETPLPLVDFFKEMKMKEVKLPIGQEGQMYRRMTKAILEENYNAVAKDLAAMANNMAKYVGSDAMFPNFYPYMAQMTLMNARKMPATFLAPMLASASPQVGPGGEAGRALRSMKKLAKNKWRDESGKSRKIYEIVDGQAVYTGPVGGYENSPMRIIVELANNPDWIMNPVNGLSIKAYVYGLLKLNPRLSKALVVDTVDTQMRLGTNLDIAWDTSVAGEITEMNLNQFVTRVFASALDAPVFGVQESGWGAFRAVRDRFTGTPPSLTFGGRSIGEVYADLGMPADLKIIAERNYAKLLEDVRAGRAPHWQEYNGALIPADDLPLEMLLEPAFRSKPGYVERFKKMVESAEQLGIQLRGKLDGS